MEPIRIVLCDDHRIVIDGLQSLLAGVPDMDCVGTALHGEEALYLLGRVKVDVLVTDLDMPDMDGYELIAQVKRTHPEVKGLVLSMLDEPAMIKRAIDLGVDGYWRSARCMKGDAISAAASPMHSCRKVPARGGTPRCSPGSAIARSKCSQRWPKDLGIGRSANASSSVHARWIRTGPT